MKWLLLLAALWAPEFRNVAVDAGLRHVFPNGGVQTKKYILETTGSGVAVIDYDNDGFPDLFVVSGEGGTNRLYHNDGKGRFTDVTAAMGLTSSGWGQGACVGDYDNDGYADLFVTNWGGNHLYRNASGKKFVDVTAAAHLTQDRVRYNTGCAFLDYDHDGRLDLFVANYLKFDFATTPGPGGNPYCWYRGMAVACGPRGLPFDRNLLYHANSDGTFSDVSDSSGIAKPVGHYGLGVIAGDFNGDGRTDIYVACDQTPSLLYINQGDGTFEEEAVLRGVAFDADGKALSGMGVTVADYDGDGLPDIFRTNFSDERETLYRQLKAGEFEDVALAAGLGRNTRFVGWGCGFLDFDNDGWTDLLLVNGHVFPEVDKLKTDIRYKDRAILYRNRGNGTFSDVSETAGAGIQEPHAARGLAIADFDNDGTLEVVVNNQNETPTLLKLARPSANHWALFQLEGRASGRSAIGAKVTIVANGHRQTSEVRGGGSYLSQNDLRLHFGLGTATKIDSVVVDWPKSGKQVVSGSAVDRVTVLREP